VGSDELKVGFHAAVCSWFFSVVLEQAFDYMEAGRKKGRAHFLDCFQIAGNAEGR